MTSDSHPDSDKEEGEDEDGKEVDDGDDDDYNELTLDEGSQVPPTPKIRSQPIPTPQSL